MTDSQKNKPGSVSISLAGNFANQSPTIKAASEDYDARMRKAGLVTLEKQRRRELDRVGMQAGLGR